MPADAGIRFGQYVLVRRIARGGMAEVFLAQQRGLEGFDRRVAVKRILPHLADSPDFVKMFFGEARLAAQLSHPNIVHIYEFGKVEHDYFIAMEFVDGVHAGQLFKHGTDGEKLPPTLVARIGADAANALHYAHELRGPNGALLGLVHRDVSPANIMVSFDGVVKLCDFGIAKAAAAGDHLTNPGQVKGKYAYMSPEQTVASQLDGRSDVFSLAIVMWELLTGKYIVPRGDAVAAMRAIRDGKLEPIEKAAPTVPAPLASAVSWALEPKRDRRATAAEFAQALEAFLKSAPELATSMQLGGWIRARFAREGTGQIPALGPPLGGRGASTQVSPGTVVAPGTQVSPGTVVAPSTAASKLHPVTPAAYPPRRVVRRISDPGDGTEIYSTADVDEQAETIKGARPPRALSSGRMQSPVAGADEPTLHARTSTLVGDVTEILRGAPGAPDDDGDLGGPTLQRGVRSPVVNMPGAAATASGRPVTAMTSGRPVTAMPGAAAPDARLMTTTATALPPGALPSAAAGESSVPDLAQAMSPDHAARALGSTMRPALSGEPTRRFTPLPGELLRPQRKKVLLFMVGLALLALASFLVALKISGPKSRVVAAPQDAPVVATAPVDAAAPVASPPVDAEIVAEAEVPPDAAPEPEPAPAPAPVEDEVAYLVVRTIPDGGKVRVGKQTRHATLEPDDPTRTPAARLVLPPGKHTVTAMLDGYRPEKRAVVLERGDHQRIEITFTKKIASRPDRGPKMGRLTVRTTPWSDVYLGGKKLGQAPFADLPLPAGTHTLTFKNPSHPTVTKTVTITPGKSAKLNFELP